MKAVRIPNVTEFKNTDLLDGAKCMYGHAFDISLLTLAHYIVLNHKGLSLNGSEIDENNTLENLIRYNNVDLFESDEQNKKVLCYKSDGTLIYEVKWKE